MSQPFMYIFMAIVIGLIVIFGAYLLFQLFSFECMVEGEKLMSDFNYNVKQMYAFSSGSNQKYSMMVPSNIQGICFVDDTAPIKLSEVPYKSLREYIELKSMNEDLDETIYFAGPDDECLPAPMKINKLKVDGGTLCFHVAKTNSFDYVLENVGRNVTV